MDNECKYKEVSVRRCDMSVDVSTLERVSPWTGPARTMMWMDVWGMCVDGLTGSLRTCGSVDSRGHG